MSIRRTQGVIVCVLAMALSTFGATSAGGSTHGSKSAAIDSEAQVLRAVAASRTLNVLPAHLSPPLGNPTLGDGLTMVEDRGCSPSYAQTSVKISNCVFGDAKGKHTLVILGDSHAAMWIPTFNLIGKRLKWRIIDLPKVNCGAADITYYLHQEQRDYTECNTWHQWAFAEINKLDPSVVVLTSLVDPYIVPPNNVLTPSAWTKGMEESLNLITSSGTKKVILGDIPYLVPAGQPQDGYSTLTPADCVAAHESDISHCVDPESVAVFTGLHQAEQTAAVGAGASYINVIPWFCTAACAPIIDNILVFENTEHITGAYAIWLSGVLQSALSSEMTAPTAK